MTPLLVAGAGYIGQEVMKQASSKGFQVVGLSRHAETLTDNEGQTHPIRRCDFTSAEALGSLAQELEFPPKTILLSASSGRGGPDAYRKVFLNGLENLLRAFPTSHLLFTSSTSVYHQTNGEIVDESSETKPIRETSQILLEAEEIVLKRAGTVARLAGIYGPSRCMSLKKLLAGTATIEKDGQRLLNQIHCRDAASALLHLASAPEVSRSQIYNIADSSPLKQIEVYQALCQHLQKALPPRGEKKTDGKRAWTHKSVSNAKLLKSSWTPLYPSFTDSLDNITSAVS